MAAEAFGASHAFDGRYHLSRAKYDSFSGEKGRQDYSSRNVHRSVMGAMVLCGAIPVCEIPRRRSFGISLGMKVDQVKRAIKANPTPRLFWSTIQPIMVFARISALL